VAGQACRDDDRAVIHGALLRLRRDARVPVTFGGPVERGRLRLSELVGTSTDLLRDISVAPGTGLGGKVVAVRRAVAVNDYARAPMITHDYDRVVRAEGLRAVIGVPVLVRDSMRAVLYGAVRTSTPLGDRVLDAATGTARSLGQDLAVRDATARHIAELEAAQVRRPGGAEWERVREAHAELRLLAHHSGDDELRDQLLKICDALTPESSEEPVPATRLSPRELDVLTFVAVGLGNAEIAGHLNVGTETVKSYLREAMRKLGVHSRYEAVHAARSSGQLP
jgi:DNA-binding CsgD family transcriptional regulator